MLSEHVTGHRSFPKPPQQPQTVDPRSLQVNAKWGQGEDESPFVSWLIYLARGNSGPLRLAAIALLSQLYRAGLTSKTRDIAVGRLLIPPLVDLIQSAPPSNEPIMSLDIAPRSLALLITDSIQLQKAAVEARAIEKLARHLKIAFSGPHLVVRSIPWSPEPQTKNSSGGDRTCQLGEVGFSNDSMNAVKSREGLLKALAAIAQFDDEHREKIIESDITAHLSDALKPYYRVNLATASNEPDSLAAIPGKENTSSAEVVHWLGNPPGVLMAACELVRYLSRSVKILRTSLVDAGIADALFGLLKHPDMDVKIIATGALCNVLLDFSPMKPVSTNSFHTTIYSY
jgi:hypothetical protein